MSKVLKLYILSVVGVQCSKCIHESLIYIRQKSCTKFHVFCCLFFRKFWKNHGKVRIGVFWIGSATFTAFVISVIATDWITWDRINRNFIASTGTKKIFYFTNISGCQLECYLTQWMTQVLSKLNSFNFVNFDLPIGRNKQHGSLITHFKIVLDKKSLSKSLVEYFIFH